LVGLKPVDFNQSVTHALRGKTKSERRAIGLAIRNAQMHFGNPHSHRGTGIQKLTSRYYELRVGLHCRMIFTNESDCLQFVAEGSHDQVKQFLKQHP
jgi:mRNA-degrading endonuclease YafQ of YafQ-DinJ toxin-antitoxin module